MTKITNRKALGLGVFLLAAGAAGLAHAESNFQTGTGTLTATAHVDFQITIPRILFLQVGTGTLFSNVATVDLVSFTVPAASVGNGTAITGTGGDLSNGTVTAILRGNVGSATLVATNAGPISNGTDTINWSEITTTPTALAGYATTLTPPTLANTTSNTVALTAANNVVSQGAQWQYKYANSALMAGGTYGGVNTNNSRVTYTATSP